MVNEVEKMGLVSKPTLTVGSWANMTLRILSATDSKILQSPKPETLKSHPRLPPPPSSLP